MTLPPLAWVVHHPAAVEADDRVHRFGCHRLDGLARILRRDAVLYRQHAPTPCPSCRPDVELRLSAPRQR